VIAELAPAREAERHALPLWPSVLRLPLGEWELRTDPAPVGRLTKRANSCLAIGDPCVPLPHAADAVRRFYGSRERPALVQVVRGSETEQAFTDLGWDPVAGGDSHFLLAALADVRPLLTDPDPLVTVAEDGPRVHAVRVSDGREVATGRAAVDDGWLAVHALSVEPDQRRRGHASALMATLLDWGATRGATTVWLHVETDNEPASAMYDALGFRRSHTCRYLRWPDRRTGSEPDPLVQASY
jgi:N-acetylglutamate synthase